MSIPEHRVAAGQRSGDTIVIGKSGNPENIDAKHRVQLAKEAADRVDAAPPKLTDITGVGPATVEALVNCGIADVEALATVDPANPPEIEGLPTTFDWSPAIEEARNLLRIDALPAPAAATIAAPDPAKAKNRKA